MPIPSEVKKTIAAIDHKIKDLEETKKRLMETFGGFLPSAKANGNRTQVASGPSAQVAPLAVGLSSGDKLADFLREHGPATRKEIYQLSGVPGGSVSYLLKTARFRQRSDEKWEVAA